MSDVDNLCMCRHRASEHNSEGKCTGADCFCEQFRLWKPEEVLRNAVLNILEELVPAGADGSHPVVKAYQRIAALKVTP